MLAATGEPDLDALRAELDAAAADCAGSSREARGDAACAADRPRVRLPIVYHPDYMAPLRPGHRFPMSKYGYLRAALIARGLLPAVGGYPRAGAGAPCARSPPCTRSATSSASRTAARRPRRRGGSACPTRRPSRAARSCRRRARCSPRGSRSSTASPATPPAARITPGPEGGAGFCVFNDVAVAARALLDEGAVGRVLIVDLRRAPGRRHRAHLRATRPRSSPCRCTPSATIRRARPRRTSTIPLPDGLADAAYLETLDHALARGRAVSPRHRLLQRRRRSARDRPARPARR